MTVRAFWQRLMRRAGHANLSPTNEAGGKAMSTVWSLIERSFSDARKAEEIVADGRARRALRRDPERVLEAFALAGRERPPQTGRARATSARVGLLRPARV